MTSLIAQFLISFAVFAGGGGGHTHGEGGETEHLYPVLGVFALLVICGIVFHLMSKKK